MDTFDRDSVRKLILSTRSLRGYFPFPYAYITIAGTFEAGGVLAYLVKQLELHVRKNKDQNGWFYCTCERMGKYLNLSKHSQNKAIKLLKDKGYIQSEVRTQQTKRYFYVDLIKIEVDLGNLPANRSDVRTGQEVKSFNFASANLLTSPIEEKQKKRKHTVEDCSSTPGATPPPGESNLATGAENSMFLKQPLPSRQQVDHFAELLDHILTKNKLYIGKRSLKKWGCDISILLRQLGPDGPCRVDKVLHWLSSHATDEFTPRVLSGLGLKNKFISLELAMKRHEEANPSVTVSAEAVSVAERLRMKIWPKGTEDSLPYLAEVYIQKCRELRKGIKNLSTNDHKFTQFAEECLNTLNRPAEFSQAYLEWVWKKIVNWRDFDGKIKEYTTRQFPTYLQVAGREIAERWNGRPETWDKLMEKVNVNGV